jgi:hypothetical protein
MTSLRCGRCISNCRFRNADTFLKVRVPEIVVRITFVVTFTFLVTFTMLNSYYLTLNITTLCAGGPSRKEESQASDGG